MDRRRRSHFISNRNLLVLTKVKNVCDKCEMKSSARQLTIERAIIANNYNIELENIPRLTIIKFSYKLRESAARFIDDL